MFLLLFPILFARFLYHIPATVPSSFNVSVIVPIFQRIEHVKIDENTEFKARHLRNQKQIVI